MDLGTVIAAIDDTAGVPESPSRERSGAWDRRGVCFKEVEFVDWVMAE